MTNTLSCTIINLDLAMSPVIEFYSDKPRTVSSKNLPQAYFYDPSVVISNQQTHFSTNLAANLYEPTPDFFLSMYSTRNATNMFPNQFRYVSKKTPNTFFEPVIFEPPILLGNFKKIKDNEVEAICNNEYEEEEMAYGQEPEPAATNESEIVHLLKDFHLIKL